MRRGHFFLVIICLIFNIPYSHSTNQEVVFHNSEGTTFKLIELFTSQGCSSCPPAEAFLNKMEQDPLLFKEIYPLSFHVDYWNHLGWKDPFSVPSYSDRQYKYKIVNAVGSVYTPGWVINGKEWKGYFDHAPLPPAITGKGSLTLRLTEDQIVSSYSFTHNNHLLNIAILGMGFNTSVQKGENRNRQLTEAFVVLHHLFKPLPSNGQHLFAISELDMTLPENPLAIVAWISTAKQSPPLQCTGGFIPTSIHDAWKSVSA